MTTNGKAKNGKPNGNGKKPRVLRHKFCETKMAAYCDLLRSGTRRMAAAKAIGVGVSTVERHMRSDAAFAKQVAEAEMQANERVEDALYQKALGGDMTAIQVWLYNRWPERWADRRNLQRVELTGRGGEPIAITTVEVVKDYGGDATDPATPTDAA